MIPARTVCGLLADICGGVAARHKNADAAAHWRQTAARFAAARNDRHGTPLCGRGPVDPALVGLLAALAEGWGDAVARIQDHLDERGRDAEWDAVDALPATAVYEIAAVVMGFAAA
jgi:hypothetical protein